MDNSSGALSSVITDDVVFTVTAAAGSVIASMDVTIERAEAEVAAITLTPPDDTSLIVPADEASDVTASFSAAVTDQYGAEITSPSVVWSISPSDTTGVTIDQSGKVTVANAAKAGITSTTATTFTVTASCGGASDSKTFTVARAASVVTGTVTGDAAFILPIPFQGTATQTYTAAFHDQYGETVTPASVTWPVVRADTNAAVPGVTIDATTGALTVNNMSSTGLSGVITNTTGVVFTVTATPNAGSPASKDVTIERAAATGNYLGVTGAATIEVPGEDTLGTPKTNSTAAFTVSAQDQYGTACDATDVSWLAYKAGTSTTIKGVTISSDGKLSIASDADVVNGTKIDVSAIATVLGGQINSVPTTVTVSKPASAATFVRLYSADTELGADDTIGIVPNSTGSKVYTAKVYDQYGAEMSASAAAVAWTLDATTGFSKTDGSNNTVTVTVTSPAVQKDASAALTATVNGKTAAVTITAKDITVDWTGIQTKTGGITYGDAKSAAFTALPKTGTATVAGSTVNGSFSIVEPDALLAAGDSRTITVRFTVTDEGTYKNVTIDKTYTVKVARRGITFSGITADNKVYDGKTAATFDSSNAVFSGKLDGDQLTITVTGHFVSNNVGTGKEVIIITSSLGGASVDNYKFDQLKVSQTTATASITAKPVTLTWNGNDGLTYTGTAKNVTAAAGDLVTGDSCTVTVSGGTQINAGTYTATATGLSNSNYALPSSGTTQSYTIAKAPLTIYSATASDKVYDGKTDAAITSVTFTGLVNGDTLAFGTDYTATGAFTQANVGNGLPFSVTVTLGTTTGANNYSLPTVTKASAGTASITPTVTTLSLTAASVEYSAAAYAAANITAASNVETTPTYTFYTDAACTIPTTAANSGASGSGAAPVNTGTYYVKGHIDASGNNSAVTSAAASFTITKKNMSGVTMAAVSDTYAYDGAAKTPTPAVTFSNGSLVTLDAGTDFTYSYSNNTNAGTATVTITAKDGGNYTGTNSETFAIGQREAELTWAGAADRTYDGKAGSVTATVGNLVGSDACAVTVTGGTQTNAGTYTATAAALGNPNYKLPSAATKQYVINKADRVLTIDPTSKTLAGGTLSFTIKPTVDSNLDNSAAYFYSSSATVVATVSGSGVVTAVGNGAATITVSVPDTTNYNAAIAKTCTVAAYAAAVTAATAASSTTTDKLTVTVSGTTITVVGAVTAGATITVSVTGADVNVTAAPATITATDAAALAAGGTIAVNVNGTTVSYKINTSGATILPANVVLDEVPATLDTSKVDAADKAAVDAALKNDNTTSTGLDSAAAAKLIEDAQKQAAGDNTKTITAETSIKIDVTGYENTQSSTALTMNITPQVTYKDDTGKTLGTETIPNSAIKAPVLVSVVLPAGFPHENLVVKHTTASGIEYIPVTVSDIGTVAAPVYKASWYQSSFSTDELYADIRTGTVDYTYADGTVKTVTYTAANLGQSLPTDTKSGYTFGGWTLDGAATKFTTVTSAFLDAIKSQLQTNHQAAGSFTKIISSGTGSPRSYTITASVNNAAYGTITPSGAVSAVAGEDKTFAITPGSGYAVKDVLVDGKSVGAVKTYTFTKVSAEHTIAVTFTMDASAVFTDVARDAWFHDVVQYVYDNDIMEGDGALFDPYGDMSRAMIVTTLYRLEGSPAVTGTSEFTDVKSGMWYTDAIIWAAQNGIAKGYDNGLFGVNDNVTREQLVTFFWRYAKYKNVDVSVGEEANILSYNDAFSISEYAIPAMQWACGAGLIEGDAGNLMPRSTATRAECATVLARYIENILK